MQGKRALGGRWPAVIVAAILGACSTLKGSKPDFFVRPVGPHRPPLPADCPIRFEELDYGDAQRLENQVGFVCVGSDSPMFGAVDPYNESVRAFAAKQACKLGGDMVVPIGVCHDGRGVAFGVFVRRQ